MAPVSISLFELNNIRRVLKRIQEENLLPSKQNDLTIHPQSVLKVDTENVVLDYIEAERLLTLLRVIEQAYLNECSWRDSRFMRNLNCVSKDLEMSIFISQMERSYLKSDPLDQSEETDDRN